MTTATTSAPRPSPVRRLAGWLYPRRGLRLAGLLLTPLGWLVIAYLGALFILLLNAFWTKDAFTGQVEPFSWTLASFQELFSNDVYRTVAIRTIGVAIAVTITDALLALPIAYYMARMASPRTRGLLVVAILMPLWASYLVKVYAWRTILQGGGLVDWGLGWFGVPGPGLDELFNSWLVFSYLWLPYMILPIYAGLERIPRSLLEASSDLGGRPGTTFRRVVLPLVFPALVAGLDLHVLAHARRLHHAGPGLGREVHRQRHLRQLEPRQPAAGRCLLAAADRDHDRLPARRASTRRVRVAVRPGR